MLIASQNPCPCGYLGDKSHTCICAAVQVSRYKKKISEPLSGSIDRYLNVFAVKDEKLTGQDTSNVENSQTVRIRVQKTRDKQQKRFQCTTSTTNSELINKTIKTFSKHSENYRIVFRQTVATMSLSRRAYYRIITLSANLAKKKIIYLNTSLKYYSIGR